MTDSRLAQAERGPLELNVYQTNRCNLSCEFCTRQYVDLESTPDMTPGLLQAVLNQYPTIRSVCFAGFGEPLVSSTLRGCVRAARMRGLFTSLITNGTLLLRYARNVRGALFGYVSVSVNAADGREYHRETGAQRSVFRAVLDGIGEIAKDDGPVYASFVVHRGNLSRVPAYVRAGINAGADKVVLHGLLPHGIEQQRDHLMQRLLRSGQDAEQIREYRQDPYLAKHVASWPTAMLGMCPRKCVSPFESIGVDGRGCVSGCRRVSPPRERFGTFRDGYQTEYWNSLREPFLCRGEAEEKCKYCFGNWSG